MRRLIFMLRQGQSYCTDGECLDEMLSLPEPENAAINYTFMFMMMAMAIVLYVLRPQRNQIQDTAKPAPNPRDNDGAPPAPPRI
ncbi:unnamed protein product [Pieris brassicae]|uniref:Small integral membrane protein 14 n=1 Tax=Pieris brassicae TaxID=7116 RepID=A0A9P0TW13_PIEBR|nr:unnamed protein product [Pieris brassicae]